jgi:hypothetical protein
MRLTPRFVVPDMPDGFVTPAKKALPFTITQIGGKSELVAWRKDQALLAEARAVATAKAYAVRREIAVEMVKAQATTTLSLTAAERAEMELRPQGQVKTPSPQNTSLQPIETQEEKNTPSLKDRLLAIPGRIWKNAFDSR